ncbi:CalY family protein [Haloarcula sp. S1AR25-5A]|uniref:CalY family protein n=1 Tax=Haloarcula terrestris TaxID=2950533 RepID=A0AAE4F236_9EURY|nr:TasA family protein [Haloarcula terrestris]MDS0223138.1 CalY family protein [Haloarcula terrestris]
MVDQAYRMWGFGLGGLVEPHTSTVRYMSDKSIELTRRRVLGGIATVGAASAAAGAGTFAYFSDEETSTGNTIQAGTVDLGSPETSGSQSLGTDLAPGDNFTIQIETTYNGSIDDVDLNLNAQLTDPTVNTETGDNTTDLSAAQFASAFKIDGNDGEAYVQINPEDDGPKDDLLGSDSLAETDINTDLDVSSGDVDDDGNYDVSGVDLNDIVSDGLSGETDYATLQNGDTVRVQISGTLDTDLGNAGQADSVDVQVAFGVQQNGESSQAPSFQ